jgi:hypothetical protein
MRQPRRTAEAPRLARPEAAHRHDLGRGEARRGENPKRPAFRNRVTAAVSTASRAPSLGTTRRHPSRRLACARFRQRLRSSPRARTARSQVVHRDSTVQPTQTAASCLIATAMVLKLPPIEGSHA